MEKRCATRPWPARPKQRRQCRKTPTDDGGTAGPSLWARRLGLGGLIPFVTLALALWLTWPPGWPPASAALLVALRVLQRELAAAEAPKPNQS